jgi:hemolysin III
MAFTGITCLWCIPYVPHEVIVSLYLAMGYFGFSGVWRYYQAVGLRGLLWCTAGAALYTLGAVCELTRWPIIWPGVIQWHEVLHICDMAATFAFFVFIVHYVIPYRAPVSESAAGPTTIPAAPVLLKG